MRPPDGGAEVPILPVSLFSLRRGGEWISSELLMVSSGS